MASKKSRKCQICKTLFTAKRRDAKTCSPACRKRLQRSLQTQMVEKAQRLESSLGRAFHRLAADLLPKHAAYVPFVLADERGSIPVSVVEPPPEKTSQTADPPEPAAPDTSTAAPLTAAPSSAAEPVTTTATAAPTPQPAPVSEPASPPTPISVVSPPAGPSVSSLEEHPDPVIPEPGTAVTPAAAASEPPVLANESLEAEPQPLAPVSASQATASESPAVSEVSAAETSVPVATASSASAASPAADVVSVPTPESAEPAASQPVSANAETATAPKAIHLEDVMSTESLEPSAFSQQSIESADGSDEPPEAPSRRARFSPFRYNKLALAATGLALLLITVVGGSSIFLTVRHNTDSAKKAKGPSSFAVTNLPLNGIKANQQLLVGDTNQLTINGQLRVNDTLVISPTDRPVSPVTGQFYYDQSTNTPYYYNGTQFISLAPGVTSLGGSSGAIGLGSGLSMTNNQLNVSNSLLQQVAAAASSVGGVTSLQGQTGDLSLGAGAGIAINGLNISNSGVTSLTGTPNQVNVSSNTGNVTLSLPQDIATTSSPTFGGLTLNGNLIATGTAAIQGSGGLSVGVAGSTAGIINLANATNSNLSVLQAAAPSGVGNANILLPSIVGGTSDTVCLVSLGNCGGSGGGVTTPGGTAGVIPVFTGAQTIADSILSQAGSTLTVAGNAIVNAANGFVGNLLNLAVNGSSKLTVDQDGNTVQAGTLTVSSTGTSSVAGNLTVGTGLTVSGGGATITGNSTINGSLAVTGANALTLGTSSTNTGAIVFKGSGGNGTLTLQGPTTPSVGNYTLSIPAISGNANICTDNSICAGYAPSSGSGNYIQNGVAPQVADFNITGTGTAGILNATSAIELNGTNINVAGTLSNVAYLNGTGPQTFTGNNKFAGTFLAQNAADSTAAFQIQKSDATPLFVVDTTNSRIAVGPSAVPATSVLTVGTNTTANTGGITFGTDTNLYRSAANTLKTDDSLQVLGRGAVGANSSITNTITLRVQETRTDTASTNVVNTYGQLDANPGANSSSFFYGGWFVAQSQAGNIRDFNSISGTKSNASHNGSGTVGDLIGNESYATNASNGNVTAGVGQYSVYSNQGSGTTTTGQAINGRLFNTAGGTITTAAGVEVSLSNISTGTINTGYGLLVTSASNAGGGTFQNNYGAYIQDQSAVGSVNSYNFYSAGATAKNYFEGTLQVGSGNLTTGVAGTTAGTLRIANATNSNLTILQAAAPSGAGNATISIPTIVGGTSDTVCLVSLGNCAGSGTGVTTPGGTSGTIALFTGSQSIGNSVITQSGSAVTVAGTLVATGANSLTLGTASTNTGAILLKNSSNANTLTLQAGATGSNLTLTLPTADGANGDCLMTNASGVLSFSSCTGGPGGGVTSLDSLTGVLTLANSSGAGSTVTINNAAADGATKGIAAFNATNFSASSGVINTIQNIATTSSPVFASPNATTGVNTGPGAGTQRIDASGNLVNIGTITSGLINGQTISSSANFTGTVAIQGASSLSLGTASTNTGSIAFYNSAGANTITLQGPVANPAGNYNLTIPTLTGNDTLCVQTMSNCTAVGSAGGDLTGSYPNPTIAKLQGTTLTLSSLASGDVLQYNGSAIVNGHITNSNLTAGSFTNITGVGALTVGSIASGFGAISTGNNISTTAALHGDTLTVGSSNQFQVDASGNLTITNTASIQGSSGLTLGAAGSVAGLLSFANATNSNLTVVQAAAPTGSGNASITIPAIAGGSSDSVCLVTLGNCAGSGGGIVGSGTAGTLAVFTGSGTIGNSILTQSGTTLTVGGNAVVNAANGFVGNLINLEVNGSSKLTVNESGNITTAGTLTVNGIGASSIAGTLSVSGAITASTLGAADTTTALCRNSSNQIATCTGTGSGAAFVQGGNSFGATAVLGTNDSNSLTFETNNTTQATIAVGGATTFQNSANSTTAFQIQNSAGTSNLLVADTTNTRIGLGIAPATTSGLGLLQVGAASSTTAAQGISFGGDTAANLYRSAASTIKTDGNLVVAGSTALTLGTASTNTGKIVLQGSGGAGTLTLAGPTTPNAGNFTLTIPAITGNANVCTDNSVCTGYAPSSGSGNYIQNGTSIQTSASFAIQPTSGNVAAVIKANGAGDLMDFQDSSGNVLSFFDASGNLTVGSASNVRTISSPGAGSQSEHFGAGSSTGATTNSLAVGQAASVSANGGTAVGRGASAAGASASLGGSAGATGTNAVAIGSGATASANNTVAIGQGASATTGQGAIAIGGGASATSTGAIAIGDQATSAAAKQLVIGSNASSEAFSIQNAYIGSGVTDATPVNFTLHATGGSGTDIVGASLSLAGGIGTGAGNGGDINLQVAKPGTTGSSLNTLATVFSLSGVDGKALFQNSANSTTAFQIQNTAGTSNLLVADTTNSRIGLGVTPITTSGSGLLQVGAASSTTAAQGISFGGDTAANLYRSAANTLKTDGNFLIQTASNSTTAFQIQNNSGNSILTGDTSANQVLLGKASTLDGALAIASASSANIVTLKAGATATPGLTFNLPTADGAANSCLQTNGSGALSFGSCATGGTTDTLQNAYDAGNTVTTSSARDINFTLADTATDSNYLVNIASGSTSKFAVQNAGTDWLSVNSTKIQVGSSSTDATIVPFVLDSYNTTDPSGTNGEMYYSTSSNKFRCYENSAWKNCDDPWIYLTVNSGSDFTTTSNTAQDVTGLAFTPAASTNYEFQCTLELRTATTTVNPRVGFAWSTGLTDGVAQITESQAATGAPLGASGNPNAALLIAVGGLPDTTGSWPATITSSIRSGASPSGNTRVQLASETNGTTVTIKSPGSMCRYRTY